MARTRTRTRARPRTFLSSGKWWNAYGRPVALYRSAQKGGALDTVPSVARTLYVGAESSEQL